MEEKSSDRSRTSSSTSTDSPQIKVFQYLFLLVCNNICAGSQMGLMGIRHPHSRCSSKSKDNLWKIHESWIPRRGCCSSVRNIIWKDQATRSGKHIQLRALSFTFRRSFRTIGNREKRWRFIRNVNARNATLDARSWGNVSIRTRNRKSRPWVLYWRWNLHSSLHLILLGN